MLSTIRYGNVANGIYVIRDSVKYGYDKLSNVNAVYENGKQVITYEYDSLSRIKRENNKKLQFTKVYSYDNNGNIILQ